MNMIPKRIQDTICGYFAKDGIEVSFTQGCASAPDPGRPLLMCLTLGDDRQYFALSLPTLTDPTRLGHALVGAKRTLLPAAPGRGTRLRIIAVDFDGCICKNRWPEIGLPIRSTIRRLKEEREAGSKLILWTCRRDDLLRAAVDACRTWGISFDAVNENIPEVVLQYGGKESRKITATEYWDDRAVRVPGYV